MVYPPLLTSSQTSIGSSELEQTDVHTGSPGSPCLLHSGDCEDKSIPQIPPQFVNIKDNSSLF